MLFCFYLAKETVPFIYGRFGGLVEILLQFTLKILEISQINCLRNRATLRFEILHSFMVYAQNYAFQVHGYTGDKNIFACCLVLYLYAGTAENPGLRTDMNE